jgi:zinc protease
MKAIGAMILAVLVGAELVSASRGAEASSAPTGVQQPEVRWPSEGPPRPLAARDVKFPEYHLRTLPNGLQVVAVLHHEQPFVSMRMLVRAGGAQDPKDKLGVADLTAALLTQGTATQTANELNDAIDFIGGSLGAGAGTDLSFLSVVVMKDSFETGLRMLSDMARRPAFAREEIDRQRQQILSSLKVNLEDPEYVADAVFRRLVYGFHPYAYPQNGTPDMLAAITRDDLLAFHRKYFVPNNVILAVVGDVTSDEAFEMVQKVFGDWERRDVPEQQVTPPPDPTRRLVIINKPDAVQTEVRVGHLGIRRNHSDFMALNLAIRILGGEGANRLHQVLRTERGLTYGAQADMNTLRETGAFEASTNTRSEATGEVLRLMVDEFWKLQRDRVGERELGEAKNYLAGSFPLTIETADAIATQVLNVLFFGLPVEQLQSFRERVNAVSVEDVQRVSRYFLRPDRLSIVLVGNASAFLPELRRLGFDRYELVEMSDLDLTAADFKRVGRPTLRPGRAPAAFFQGRLGGQLFYTGAGAPPPARSYADARPRVSSPSGEHGRRRSLAYQQSSAIVPQAGAEAQTLLDKVIAAKGGLERLRGVKTITAYTRAEMPSGAGPVSDVAGRGRGARPPTAETVTYLEYPNHVRVETKMPEGSIVQVYDGSRAWVKDPSGVHDVPERMVRDLQLTLRRDTIAALLAAREGTLRARVLPDVKGDRGQLHHALELSGRDFDPMVLYIDPSTYLVSQQTYVAGGAGQPLIEERFGDYKPIDGLQVAFTASVRRADVTVLERKLTDIKINAPIDPALFRRPD